MRFVELRIRRFLRETSASATVEYALFLTLIAGCAIFGAELLSAAVEDSVVTLTQQLPSNAPQAAADANATTPAPVRDLTAAAPQPSAPRNTDWHEARYAVPFLFAGWTVWYLLHRRTQRLAAREIKPTTAAPPVDQDPIYAKRQQILQALRGQIGEQGMQAIQVVHLMSTRLAKVRPDATRQEVEEIMRKQRLRHLLVCDNEGKLAGIISDRDVQKPAAARAQQMMSPDPLSVEAESSVHPAITQLLHHRISCLPVVRNEKPCGVLTVTDLMMAFQCMLQIAEGGAAPHASGGDGEPPGDAVPTITLQSDATTSPLPMASR